VKMSGKIKVVATSFYTKEAAIECVESQKSLANWGFEGWGIYEFVYQKGIAVPTRLLSEPQPMTTEMMDCFATELVRESHSKRCMELPFLLLLKVK